MQIVWVWPDGGGDKRGSWLRFSPKRLSLEARALFELGLLPFQREKLVASLLAALVVIYEFIRELSNFNNDYELCMRHHRYHVQSTNYTMLILVQKNAKPRDCIHQIFFATISYRCT